MVQDLAKEMIAQAVECEAQDIYIIPRKDDYDVLMRIGDERRFIGTYGYDRMASLISHFKFVAGMTVGEKRRSQLGSCDYDFGNDELVSLRLSTVGDYRGHESLVIRLLYDGRRHLNYWFNGMQEMMATIDSRGLYLFSGPTGSGKTTLMYQLLQEKFSDKQIISIEDPVEIKDDRILQLQLNEDINMTYNSLIKLSLRHRPDVLVIGEIRDKETARAAIRASLTGTIVFATIHAKSISGVYHRLIELGVSEDEVKNSLAGICYQRLIGGGGLIDVAKDNFKDHVSSQWNQQLVELFKSGHLSEEQIQIESINYPKAG
ncbi:competence type IV pilus ATPase ComGA [Streptococcus halotolerans]|uniref:competence type IV pilus ATPase ComGA n=1 Tax=Streptococcus halotolerans TaxID=1814128 RepID=UPI000786BB44|nr:competence type IV pilus ATPase ComGA [Streptococcus halotolerans]